MNNTMIIIGAGNTAPLTYTVKKGDTLSGIAAAQGITMDEIKELNPQITNPDLIHVGDEITVYSEKLIIKQAIEMLKGAL